MYVNLGPGRLCRWGALSLDRAPLHVYLDHGPITTWHYWQWLLSKL